MALVPSEGENQDDRRGEDADADDEGEEDGGHRPAEVERPARSVASGNEQRRVLGVLVELAEPPVVGHEGPRSRPAEPDVGPNRHDARQDEADQLEVVANEGVWTSDTSGAMHALQGYG